MLPRTRVFFFALIFDGDVGSSSNFLIGLSIRFVMSYEYRTIQIVLSLDSSHQSFPFILKK